MISLLNDVLELDISDDSMNDLVDQEILPQIVEFIRSLNEEALERVQGDLILYFTEVWPETYPWVMADIVSNIFSFIVQNLEDEAVDEYVSAFLNPNLPPQIRYFILPSLLANSQAQKLDEDKRTTDLALFQRFDNIVSKCVNGGVFGNKDEHFVKLMWSQLNHSDCNTTGTVDKLLPLCVSTAKIMKNLSQEIISEVFLVTQNQFLHSCNPLAVLASAVLLLGAKELEFQESDSTWTQVCDTCTEIVKCSKQIVVPSAVGLFSMKCICCFMDCVRVESEDMVLTLESRILNIKNEPPEVPRKSSTQRQHEQKTDNANANGSTEFLVPMFEKITTKIVGSKMCLNASEIERLSSAMTKLNNFISKS